MKQESAQCSVEVVGRPVYGSSVTVVVVVVLLVEETAQPVQSHPSSASISGSVALVSTATSKQLRPPEHVLGHRTNVVVLTTSSQLHAAHSQP